MLMLAVLVQAASGIAPVPVSHVDDTETIVVLGRKLDDTKQALSDCIVNHCPPREEIARSLAYADTQFVAGDYQGSRRTLLTARRRNARYAATLPVEVAGLHRANARLAGLNGLTESAQIGAYDAVDALKKGAPTDIAAIMLQRLEVGDSQAKFGQINDALGQYRHVAAQARRAKLPSVEGMAMFRRAVLLSAVASVKSSYTAEARHAVAAINARPEPEFLPFRDGVRLMAVRLAAGKNKDAVIDKAAATLDRTGATQEPVVLYDPPIDMQDAAFGVAAPSDAAQWADVTFRITPDGRVADVSTLRTSVGLNQQWVDVATRSLRQRRYQPLGLPATAPGIVKAQRYSFVADRAPASSQRSRISVRSAVRRVDVVELTIQAPSKS